jgi:hypothetical protein
MPAAECNILETLPAPEKPKAKAKAGRAMRSPHKEIKNKNKNRIAAAIQDPKELAKKREETHNHVTYWRK